MTNYPLSGKTGFCALLAVVVVSGAFARGETPPAVSVSVFPAAGQEINVIDHFPLKDGLTWKYNSDLGEVVSWVKFTGKKCIIISQSPHLDLEQHLVLTEKSILLSEGRSNIYFFKTKRTYHPPLLRLPIPLQTGQSWSWEGTEIVDGESLHTRVKGIVEGEETIRVPAGEFTCLKVKVTTVSSDGTTSSSTQWLAPGVGIVKADIEIDPGGLTGFLIWLLGMDKFKLELKEMIPPPSNIP